MGNINFKKFKEVVLKLVENKKYYNNMAKKCSGFFDKKGAERIAKLIQ